MKKQLVLLVLLSILFGVIRPGQIEVVTSSIWEQEDTRQVAGPSMSWIGARPVSTMDWFATEEVIQTIGNHFFHLEAIRKVQANAFSKKLDFMIYLWGLKTQKYRYLYCMDIICFMLCICLYRVIHYQHRVDGKKKLCMF